MGPSINFYPGDFKDVKFMIRSNISMIIFINIAITGMCCFAKSFVGVALSVVIGLFVTWFMGIKHMFGPLGGIVSPEKVQIDNVQSCIVYLILAHCMSAVYAYYVKQLLYEWEHWAICLCIFSVILIATYTLTIKQREIG